MQDIFNAGVQSTAALYDNPVTRFVGQNLFSSLLGGQSWLQHVVDSVRSNKGIIFKHAIIDNYINLVKKFPGGSTLAPILESYFNVVAKNKDDITKQQIKTKKQEQEKLKDDKYRLMKEEEEKILNNKTIDQLEKQKLQIQKYYDERIQQQIQAQNSWFASAKKNIGNYFRQSIPQLRKQMELKKKRFVEKQTFIKEQIQRQMRRKEAEQSKGWAQQAKQYISNMFG